MRTMLSSESSPPSNSTDLNPNGLVELFQVPTSLVALLSVVYGAVSLVSVLGNACVLYAVASRRRMRSVTNYFIANLAVADIIIGLFAVPFQFQAALLQKWVLPDFLCAFCPFVQVLSVNVSVLTLAAIAFDRYRVVIHPLRHRPRNSVPRAALFSVWFLGALAALPYALALRVVLASDPATGQPTRPFCTNVRAPPAAWTAYRVALVALQYALPLTLISYAYGRMALRLRSVCTTVDAPRDQAVLRSRKKVIKMLAIVVAIFAICWLPFQTYNVLQEILPQINEYKYINVIWFCAHWLAMSNSCYNPFIYAIYNKRFQDEFLSQWRCRKQRRPRPRFDSDPGALPDRQHLADSLLTNLERCLENPPS